MRYVSGTVLVIVLAVTLVAAGGAAPPQTRTPPQAPGAVANVIVVTLDGMRWQEFFGGAERALFGKDADKADPPTAVKRFWRETPEVRRAALMPFMWGVVARDGQVFGDPSRNSLCARHQRPLVLVSGLRRDACAASPTRGSTATTRSRTRT